MGFIGKTGLAAFMILSLCLAGGFDLSESSDRDELRATLFKDADEALRIANDKEVFRYAPEAFKKAMTRYKEAEQDFQKNKSLESIQKRIKEATELFKEATDLSDRLSTILETTIKARKDAFNADAPRYAPDLWKKGEEKFKYAVQYLEDGDEKSGKNRGKEADLLYRDAELDAIKTNNLKEAWTLLEGAKDLKVHKNAPKTLKKAQDLAKKAGELFEKNRYNNKEAKELAEKAKYEASHAIYLHKRIEILKSEDRTLEDVILESEIPLIKIAGALGKTAQFDKGVDIPISETIRAIQNLQRENERTAQQMSQVKETKKSEVAVLKEEKEGMDKTIEDKDAQVAALKENISKLESQVIELKKKEAILGLSAKREEMLKAKLASIKASFKIDEGEVLSDADDNVILRLHGLTFPEGEVFIEPKIFGLLSKVNDAIAQYPDCNIIVEGHTDSTGNSADNLKLSADRAIAIKEYIVTNASVPRDRVEAKGMGDMRPVASEKTEKTRALNRRIEIIIKPAK